MLSCLACAICFLLSGCKKEVAPCFYIGAADDLLITSEFVEIDNAGIPVCRLALDLELDSSVISKLQYKWEINGQQSLEDNIVIKDKAIENGFVKILNPEDDCFVYKAINENFDFSTVCDYLGDEDFFEIEQEVIHCDEDSALRRINVSVVYKGPNSMGLDYEWEIEGEQFMGQRILWLGKDVVKGTLKATNPEDGCFITKQIEIDATEPGGFIGNRVWKDSYLNTFGLGVLDSSDDFLKDIQVELLSYPSLELIQATITDEKGEYFFIGIPSGNYVVKFEKPQGMSFVRKYGGDNEFEDSNANENGYTDTFFLAECEANLSIDAGLKDD